MNRPHPALALPLMLCVWLSTRAEAQEPPQKCPVFAPLSPADFTTRCINETATSADRVVVCVDATNPADPQFCRNAGRTCDLSAELEPNKDIEVHTFHRSDQTVSVELTGSVGTVTTIFPGTSPKASGLGTDCAPLPTIERSRHSVGRRSTEFVDLKVTLKENEKAAALITKPLRIKRGYRFALRTGIGALYSPADRQYEARASNNANNPGKEVAVSAGDDVGIPSAELMVGVSWFSEPIDAEVYDPVFSLFAGLGVIAGTAKGVEAFTSLVVGPELSLGKDFSLAVVGGIRRTQVLQDDLAPGSALPAGEESVPTSLSVTPTLGVMINLSPYVFSVVQQR